jgi:hypothetical protein
MVGISVDYRRQDLLNYIAENKIDYPQIDNGPDLSAGVVGELGVDQAPYAILVDPHGTIVNSGGNAEEIQSLLEEALPKPALPTGK